MISITYMTWLSWSWNDFGAELVQKSHKTSQTATTNSANFLQSESPFVVLCIYLGHFSGSLKTECSVMLMVPVEEMLSSSRWEKGLAEKKSVSPSWLQLSTWSDVQATHLLGCKRVPAQRCWGHLLTTFNEAVANTCTLQIQNGWWGMERGPILGSEKRFFDPSTLKIQCGYC